MTEVWSRRLRLQGGDYNEYFREYFHMNPGRVSMSQDWSKGVSVEVTEVYMPFQGRLQHYSLSPSSKV